MAPSKRSSGQRLSAQAAGLSWRIKQRADILGARADQDSIRRVTRSQLRDSNESGSSTGPVDATVRRSALSHHCTKSAASVELARYHARIELLGAQLKDMQDLVSLRDAAVTALRVELQSAQDSHKRLSDLARSQKVDNTTLRMQLQKVNTAAQRCTAYYRKVNHQHRRERRALMRSTQALRANLAASIVTRQHANTGLEELRGRLRATTHRLEVSLADLAVISQESSRTRLCLDMSTHDVEDLRSQLRAAQYAAAIATDSADTASAAVARTQRSTEELTKQLQKSRKKSRMLQMRLLRKSPSAVFSHKRTSTRASQDRKIWSLVSKRGVYTSQARALARMLVKSGCSQERAGDVIQNMARSFGLMVKHRMSPRTVGRAILEGGVAAKVQLGYEILKTESLTLSGDGTTHRSINYESRHINLAAPKSYKPPSDSDTVGEALQSEHKVRLVGVHSSSSHTSEAQLAGWKECVHNIVDVFNRSPLASANKAEQSCGESRTVIHPELSNDLDMADTGRTCTTSMGAGLGLDLAMFTTKLVGMHTDHAEDQKKLSRIVQGWKSHTSREGLGAQYLLDSCSGEVELDSELMQIFLDAGREAVDKAGGSLAWSQSTDAERMQHEMHISQQLAAHIGDVLYGRMSADMKQDFDLFIWAGCCMHKDLNAVKGGAATMSSWWKANNVQGPIPLANKDNAATLDSRASAAASDPGSCTTEAQSERLAALECRAAEISVGGAVKHGGLMGALVNHQNDKKGHHDTFRNAMKEETGIDSLFPDTSNTRYQSYPKASAEIITHRQSYIRFLETVRRKKEKRNFNHLEKNVYSGFFDMPTLTEHAVLALYSECVSKGYMRSARNSSVNILDLGPLHEQVCSHIKELIAHPHRALSPDADPKLATLDGLEWERPEMIAAIHELSPEIPHLCCLFVAFLEGALVTWTRFSSEFAEDGVIASTSALERERAWMPSTNDVNEGALGSFRVYTRAKPNTTMHRYNAQAMYNHNQTEDFMDVHLASPEDEAFIRKEARTWDESHLERERRTALAKHDLEVAEEHHRRDEQRKAKKTATLERLANVCLILDIEQINSLTVAQLKDQLDALRMQDKEIPIESRIKKKQEKRDALFAAVARYEVRQLEHSQLEGMSAGKDVDVGVGDTVCDDNDSDTDE